MDYFRILNLNQEPFSNSPEPEFFFAAAQYQACLQKLELAIRLCRGLNIVLGEVGTGKTTLCRELLVRLDNCEQGGKEVEVHLVMDPSFGTPLEFLRAVGKMLQVYEAGDEGSGPGLSEWQLKERIKNYLFQKGVDENRIVLLIVDEGQKLPDFCVEILREFLNYETNQRKLLQMVIFAQQEFEEFLRSHRNFADRVNQYLYLKPLGFLETVRMVRFRLAKAASAREAPPLISLPGLWAVYWVTHGYPRQINTLCHQVMLSLIIQNSSRAGWMLVRACAERTMLYKSRIRRWALAAGAGFLVVVVAGVYGVPGRTGILNGFFPAPKPASKETVQSLGPAIPGKEASLPAPVKDGGSGVTVKAGEAPPSEIKERMPELIGRLTIRKGSSMGFVFNDIYGAMDAKRFSLLVKANPQIKNINVVKAGTVLNLPAVRTEGNPFSAKPYWVQVARKESLTEAYDLLKNYPVELPSLWLVPSWTAREGLRYLLLLRDGFNEEPQAARKLKELPGRFGAQSKIVNTWPKDVVFFSRK